MEDRKTYAIALVLASASIIGLVLAGRLREALRPPVRILRQTNATNADEAPVPDGSPGIYLLIEINKPSPSDKETKLQVVDATGRSLPSQYISIVSSDPDSDVLQEYYWVPLGYSNPIEGPRLKAIQQGQIVADLPLQSFPRPRKTDLRPTISSPVHLFAGRGLSNDYGTIGRSVVVEARTHIPSSVEWNIGVLSTSFDSGPSFRANPRFGYFGSPSILSSKRTKSNVGLPYVEVGEVVRLRVKAVRSLSFGSKLIRIRGVRLVQRAGETEFLLPQSPLVVQALGATFTFMEASPHTVSAQDHRRPKLALKVSTGGKDILPSTEMNNFGLVDIVSPHPAELAVAELSVGARHLDYYSKLTGRPSSKPFDLVLQLRRTYGGETISDSEYNVPIEARK